MKAKTEIGLDDAVAHWKRLSKCKTAKEVKAEGYNAQKCALCELFFDRRCNGCPVKMATRRRYCEGSPYHAAARELYSFVLRFRKTFPRKAVLAELNFLKSLRNNEDKQP